MRRVFLVDDEALALRRLTRILEATGRVEIVGQTTDPEAAIEAIAGAVGLDLVFLDISMPGLDGFELCARLPSGVMVVFTTAHDEHALRAFQTNAIDYLLKPIREDELTRALDKLDRLRELPAADAHDPLARAMAAILEARGPWRIASRLGDKVHLIDLDRITHFVAEDKLTYAVTAERSYVIDPSIAELEDAMRATASSGSIARRWCGCRRSPSCRARPMARASGSAMARPSFRWPASAPMHSRTSSGCDDSPDHRPVTDHRRAVRPGTLADHRASSLKLARPRSRADHNVPSPSRVPVRGAGLPLISSIGYRGADSPSCATRSADPPQLLAGDVEHGAARSRSPWPSP